MKHLAVLLSAVLAIANLCAQTPEAAVKRYWQAACYRENTFADHITNDFKAFFKDKNYSGKELIQMISEHNELIDAVRKDDFRRAYTLFMKSMKRTSQAKNVKITPADQINQKNQDQFMAQMKQLTADLPAKHEIALNKSLKITTVKVQGDTATVQISCTDIFKKNRLHILTLVKSNGTFRVREHRELPQEEK